MVHTYMSIIQSQIVMTLQCMRACSVVSDSFRPHSPPGSSVQGIEFQNMLQYGKFENILLYGRIQAEKDNYSLILFGMIKKVWKDGGDGCITL